MSAHQRQAHEAPVSAMNDEGLGAPANSRNSVGGGKRDMKVESRVTSDLKFDLERRCHLIDISVSDYIEQLLAASLYGVDHVISVNQDRLKKVCGLSGLWREPK